MNFLQYAVTSSVFELEQCSLRLNGVELNEDYYGDQLAPLLGIEGKKWYNKPSCRTLRLGGGGGG